MSDNFTWVPFLQELANKLLLWRDRQPELVQFLESLRSPTVPVTKLMDRDVEGNQFLVEEIDPFTVLGVVNRAVNEDARFRISQAMKTYFSIDAPIPRDFAGVPTLIPMSSWFFGFKDKRGLDDVANLWKLLELALQPQPFESTEFLEVFDRVLNQRQVNVNITMALFWVRPDTFVSLDKHMRSHLDIRLPAAGITAAFYRDTVKRLEASGFTPLSASHEAWLGGNRPELTQPTGESDSTRIGHWLVGAYWAGVDPPDQTQRFLSLGIWENGYEDRYLDEIRSIQVGDKIAIKASSTRKHNLPFDARGNTVSKMAIKAIGTVVKNVGDCRSLEVEWDAEFQSKDWYFFTNLLTVWRLRTDQDYRHLEYSERLIDFVWHGGEQDYSWFVERLYGSDHPPQDDDIPEPYSSEDVITQGAFMDLDEVEKILDRLRAKKALILQGPPGVGKTFLANRIAYALMEERAPDRVMMVQFHQSYAYEDFIRGYRPQPDRAGAFALRDGLFFEFCQRAQQDPDHAYVFIIDEINRGNLSQIFGESLMLIEADKRRPEYALPLVYRHEDEPNFYVPGNVHLIGLMNVADRSLAMIDYALRRRFAFVNLEPRFEHPAFEHWLRDRGMAPKLISHVVGRLSQLNATIAADQLLGRNYVVGHSFFTPRGSDFSELDEDWYHKIVSSEIEPLLHEYWYDNTEAAETAIKALKVPLTT